MNTEPQKRTRSRPAFGVCVTSTRVLAEADGRVGSRTDYRIDRWFPVTRSSTATGRHAAGGRSPPLPRTRVDGADPRSSGCREHRRLPGV